MYISTHIYGVCTSLTYKTNPNLRNPSCAVPSSEDWERSPSLWASLVLPVSFCETLHVGQRSTHCVLVCSPHLQSTLWSCRHWDIIFAFSRSTHDHPHIQTLVGKPDVLAKACGRKGKVFGNKSPLFQQIELYVIWKINECVRGFTCFPNRLQGFFKAEFMGLESWFHCYGQLLLL